MKRKKGKKEKKKEKKKNPYYTHVCRRQRPRFTQCKPHHVYTPWCLEAEKGRSLPAAGAQQQTRGMKPDTDSLKCIAITKPRVICTGWAKKVEPQTRGHNSVKSEPIFSVATYARCGGSFSIHLTTNLPRNFPLTIFFLNRFRFNISHESVAHFFGPPSMRSSLKSEAQKRIATSVMSHRHTRHAE